MADTEIRFVGDMERLQLQPGDRFVLKADRTLSMDERRRIESLWKQFAGPDVPLLILHPGMELVAINVPAEKAED